MGVPRWESGPGEGGLLGQLQPKQQHRHSAREASFKVPFSRKVSSLEHLMTQERQPWGCVGRRTDLGIAGFG